jgi:two-component sensor histidine kinase
MLQRVDPAEPSDQPSSDGEGKGRRRASSRIEKAFPQFLVIAILLPLLFFGFAAYRDWVDIRTDAETRVTYVRDALVEHAQRVFKTHELAALATRDRMIGSPIALPAPILSDEPQQGMHGYLVSLASAFPEIASISVINAGGRLIASSTQEAVTPVDFSQTPWFTRLQSGEASRVIEPDPAQHAIAQGLFSLIFRHDDAAGEFAGAVRLAISPGYFNVFHSGIAPERGVITLFHENGDLLSRYPPDPALAMGLAQDEEFRAAAAEEPTGVIEHRSPVDGEQRLYGYARVGEYPVFLAYGLSRSDMMRIWLGRLGSYGGFFIPAAAALLVLALFAWRNHRELEDTVELRTHALSAAIAEKNQLLKEVHHRVKNNMQIISSLIRMQERVHTSPDETIRRVQAMALVHDLIYSHGDFASVNLAAYAHRLVEGVRRGREEPLEFDLQLEPVTIALDRAMPFALILSEVVSNAASHSFPDEDSRISIILRREGDEIELCVDDDGVGENPEIDGRGFGLRLIKSLSVQLGARMTYERRHGATFRLRFPVDPV